MRMLKVREAHVLDVDKGIARIDPKDLAFYGFEEGSVVLLEGKRMAPVRLFSCGLDDRGQGVILLDRGTRENLEVAIDASVEMIKAKVAPGVVVLLDQVGGDPVCENVGGQALLESFLEKRPLIRGNRFRATLWGTSPCEFSVVRTEPEGVVIVCPDTRVEVSGRTSGKKENTKKSRISYEDIGGLGPQIKKIRELVEIPLRYPEIFRKLGIDPPKGILLYGPPGSGKTALARAVANETDAFFSSISGPEIIGKYYGESEARLRAVFEEANKKAPSILFIDEIDAIAPKREEMGGEKQVERRVVAQLLALMDGLESRGRVIVMAATNIPNSLEPALRRPGRFDREIPVPIPNREGRLEILEIHTRGMPKAEGVDLERLSARTHGFVGADLEALAKEAAMNALRRILPSIDLQQTGVSWDATVDKLQVTGEDFEEALKEIEPSALREVYLEVPDVGWQDVGGLEKEKQALREAVEWPLWNDDLYHQLGMRPPRGILIHGRAGSGKTLLVKALARESGLNFIFVQGSVLLSRYIGEGEKALRQAFRFARQSAPSILCLDGIDSLFPAGGEGKERDTVVERLLSQFSSEMGGIEDLRGVTVIGTALKPENLDPRLLGAGRLEMKIGLGDPEENERLAILQLHTRTKPLSPDVDLAAIAKSTPGMNGAELENLCRLAAEETLKAYLESGRRDALVQIGCDHFDTALRRLATK